MQKDLMDKKDTKARSNKLRKDFMLQKGLRVFVTFPILFSLCLCASVPQNT